MLGFERFSADNAHWLHVPFEAFLKTQKELGIQTIHLWGAVPHLWVDHFGCEGLDELQELVRCRGMQIVSFAPAPYNYSLAIPTGSLRQRASLNYYRVCVDVAARLKAVLCLPLAGGCRDTSVEERLLYLTEALRLLCGDAAEQGVTVALCAGEDWATAQALACLLEQVQCLSLCVKLDIQSAYARGETVGQWLNLFGTRLAHITLPDVREEGKLPIKAILKELSASDYQGVIALRPEGGEDPVGADVAHANRLRRLLAEVKA